MVYCAHSEVHRKSQRSAFNIWQQVFKPLYYIDKKSDRIAHANQSLFYDLVRRMRLELTRSCDHYPLKVACIPISPPALIGTCVRERTRHMSLFRRHSSLLS